MKDTAHEIMQRGFARMVDRDRKVNAKSVFSRGKHLENIDINQLPYKSKSVLVDENGNFFFIAGYSRVGGGDVVRP